MAVCVVWGRGRDREAVGAISVLSQSWWSAPEGGWCGSRRFLSSRCSASSTRHCMGTRIRGERRSCCEQLCECVRVRASVACVQREQAARLTGIVTLTRKLSLRRLPVGAAGLVTTSFYLEHPKHVKRIPSSVG